MSAPSTVVVTGGASGIGLAIAEQLLGEGRRVTVIDRSPGPSDDARERLEPFAAQLRWVEADVTDEEQVEAAIEEADADGTLRGLVTSAGIGENVPFLETSLAMLRRALDVNLVGTFIAGRAAAARMRRNGGGAIVTISSVSGYRASPGRAAYAASKGGVLTLTKVMALELAAYGIRVNCVAPGATETPLLREIHRGGTAPAVMRAVPLGRFAQPAETAASVAFLLDERHASFVTGQTLTVDGGQTVGAGWSAPSTAADEPQGATA